MNNARRYPTFEQRAHGYDIDNPHVPAARTAAPVLITGNTYPHRDRLKALGGRWVPTARGWAVPAVHADKARAIVSWVRAPAPAPVRRSFCCEYAAEAHEAFGHLPGYTGRCVSCDTSAAPCIPAGAWDEV